MHKKTLYLIPIVVFTGCSTPQADTALEECKRLFDENLLQQAIPACTKAANTNNRPAQTMLGEIYDESGDSEKTAYWWNLAADAGHQPARNLLALKYYYGGTVFDAEKGWPQSYSKAYEIWLNDAEQEIASSQFMIGVMYQKGQGLEQNYSEAWFWLKRALKNGYKLATDVLIEISREITPEQKQIAEEKLASK